MNLRQAYRAWSRPVHLTLIAGAVCLSGMVGAYVFYAPSPSASSIIPASTVRPVLNENDQLLYEAIFRAESRGDHTWADQLLTQVENQILLGSVLATRYLGNDYRASGEELALWLERFSDQPEAPRMRALAERKGAPTDRLAALSAIKPLKGDGYVDHLGRRSAPANFYRGLALWKQQDYRAALSQFRQAATKDKLSPWHLAAAQYWAYRAAVKLNDSAAAHASLTAAAMHGTTFYGQLANAQLGNRHALIATRPYVPSALRALPAIQRAQALALVNERERAEDELRLLAMTLDVSERPAVLTLAAEMGLANLQVRLGALRALGAEEKIFAAYPMPAWLVNAQHMVDPALLLAMARQESSFRDEVKSHMGAVGMMQMLPSTARHVERSLSASSLTLASNEENIPLSQQLDDPGVNVRLGAEYVLLLARQPMVKQSLIQLIAAYNAGPGTVQGWQKLAQGVDDPLLYIESIPYPETRNYVMQVLAHQWVYQSLMGQDASGRDALTRGAWPSLQPV